MTGENCRLIDIALMPQVRGRGFGTALLTDLMSFAAASGKPVTLSVLPDNPARRLYVRLGFATTQTSDTRVRMVWQPPG